MVIVNESLDGPPSQGGRIVVKMKLLKGISFKGKIKTLLTSMNSDIFVQ